MARYEHRVYRVKVDWDGGDYYLTAMVQKSDWTNVDHLGEIGWQFIAFVPEGEYFISDSFPGEQIKAVRLAVFRRELEEGEEMWTDIKARV